jgi:hypothetical protein
MSAWAKRPKRWLTMRKGLVAFAKALRAALWFLVALWLAAFYGLVGDIEGFDRWRQWFEGRRD